MHKKLASDLTSLAHSILQMKNKADVLALKEKAYQVYEKLSVLAYVDEYLASTPNAQETKEELVSKIADAQVKKEEAPIKTTAIIGDLDEEEVQMDDFATDIANDVIENIELNNVTSKIIEELTDIEPSTEKIIGDLDEAETQMSDFATDIAENVVEKIEEESISTTIVNEIIEQPFEELEDIIFGNDDNKKFDEASFIEEIKAPTLEDELKDTLSVDVTADLFTKPAPKKSLNDRLQNTIQIDLNDRIAFVKHLFNGDSADFNRVVSQLNTLDNHKEAKKFINKTVKPDYDWSSKEEYENRLLEIIERRFT